MRKPESTYLRENLEAVPAEPSKPPSLDPVIAALLDHLPAPGDDFPDSDRALWIAAIEAAFNLIYGRG